MLNEPLPKVSPIGSNSPASREASTVDVESLVFPLIATEQPMPPVKSTLHKEKFKARKATKAAMKQPAVMKAVNPLAKAADELTGSQVTVSTGSMVINCVYWLVISGTLIPVLVCHSHREDSGYVTSTSEPT